MQSSPSGARIGHGQYRLSKGSWGVCGAVVYDVVLSAFEVISNNGRRWHQHRKVPRSCRHVDYRNVHTAFRRFAHATNVHVEIGGCGFVQNAK